MNDILTNQKPQTFVGVYEQRSYISPACNDLLLPKQLVTLDTAYETSYDH